MIDDKEYLAKVAEWAGLGPQLWALKAREMELRKELFAFAFPNPLEGTNKADLPENWLLKGTYKLDRSVDEAAFNAIKDQLRAININPDPLVRFKPELAVRDYKALSEQARGIFDQCLLIKSGAPSLELVPPKVNAP